MVNVLRRKQIKYLKQNEYTKKKKIKNTYHTTTDKLQADGNLKKKNKC